MLASFSIVPLGTGEDMREEIARVLDLVDKSGLNYRAGAMQTTVEGKADEVMGLITQCHALMKSIAARVITSIMIDDRGDETGGLEEKVKEVEEILGRDLRHE